MDGEGQAMGDEDDGLALLAAHTCEVPRCRDRTWFLDQADVMLLFDEYPQGFAGGVSSASSVDV